MEIHIGDRVADVTLVSKEGNSAAGNVIRILLHI